MRKLITLALIATVSVAMAQSQSERTLFRKLTAKGSDAASGLEVVLKKSDGYSAVILYVAASVAFREKRTEDAGFLFYIAHIRTHFDREVFPPTGSGGSSPLVALAALQQQLGSVINPALMSDPTVFSNALSRTRAWSPKAPFTYEPGWEYTKKWNPKEAEARIQDGRREFLEGMDGMLKLLQDPRYLAAFRTAQAYNLKIGSERPSKDAFESAMGIMAQIEREKGISGIASVAEGRREPNQSPEPTPGSVTPRATAPRPE